MICLYHLEPTEGMNRAAPAGNNSSPLPLSQALSWPGPVFGLEKITMMSQEQDMGHDLQPFIAQLRT